MTVRQRLPAALDRNRALRAFACSLRGTEQRRVERSQRRAAQSSADSEQGGQISTGGARAEGRKGPGGPGGEGGRSKGAAERVSGAALSTCVIVGGGGGDGGGGGGGLLLQLRGRAEQARTERAARKSAERDLWAARGRRAPRPGGAAPSPLPRGGTGTGTGGVRWALEARGSALRRCAGGSLGGSLSPGCARGGRAAKMRLLAWCLLAACVAQIAGKVDVKVVGGKPVPLGSRGFLWAASLQDAEGRHFCGGTLVAPGWVVTAAHCVFQKAAPAQVVLGAVMLSDSNAVRRSVQSVVVHDQYNSDTMRFDVALLQLSADVTSVAPLGLVDSVSQEKGGCSAGLVGWGSTRSYGGMVSQLNYASVPIQTYAECTAPGALPANGVFNDVNICAGLTSGGVDTCSGDSGGPLFSLSPRRLIGITSWGQGCGLPKKYGVYTRVSAIKSWIASRTAGGSAPVARPTERAPSTSLAAEVAFCKKWNRLSCVLQGSRCSWAGSACTTPLMSDPAFSLAPTGRPSSTARPTRRPTPKPTPKPTPMPTPPPPDYYSNDSCAGKTKRECKADSSCEWDSGSRRCHSSQDYTSDD